MQKNLITLLVFILLSILVNRGVHADSTINNEFKKPPTNILKVVPDVVLLRPIALSVAMVPTAVFVATLPPTYVTGHDKKAATLLVQKPWDYITNRPLGVFRPPPNPTRIIDEKMTEDYCGFLQRTRADLGNLDLR